MVKFVPSLSILQTVEKTDGHEEHRIICKLNQTVAVIANAVPDVAFGGGVYQHNPQNLIRKKMYIFHCDREYKKQLAL